MISPLNRVCFVGICNGLKGFKCYCVQVLWELLGFIGLYARCDGDGDI